MTRSVAKNRSATRPTKNGETSDATEVVPKTAPACGRRKSAVCWSGRCVMVTYQAPQMTYWRNIITPRRVLRNVPTGTSCHVETARQGRRGSKNVTESTTTFDNLW